MISQTSNFSINFINSLTVLVSELLTFFAVLAFVLILTIKEFYLILFVLIIILIIYYLILRNKIYDLSKKIETQEIERLKNLTNGIDSINEINIFNIKNYFIKNDLGINKKIIKYGLTKSLIRIFPRSLIEIVLILFFVIFAFYLTKNKISIVDYIPFMTILTAALFKFIPTLTRSLLAAQRIVTSKPIIENIHDNYLSSVNQNINHNLDEKVKLRSKQIILAMRKLERNTHATQRVLYNFISINPHLDGGFAQSVSHLAGKIADQIPAS